MQHPTVAGLIALAVIVAGAILAWWITRDRDLHPAQHKAARRPRRDPRSPVIDPPTGSIKERWLRGEYDTPPPPNDQAGDDAGPSH
jgi:hypothetical protein